MTLADDLKPALYDIRSIPGTFGLYVYRVDVVTIRQLDAFKRGQPKSKTSMRGTEGDNQNPKVRFLSNQERELWQMSRGGIEIGPITPSFVGGGTTLASISRETSANDRNYVKITGPGHESGSKFSIRDIKSDRGMHFTMTCQHEPN